MFKMRKVYQFMEEMKKNKNKMGDEGKKVGKKRRREVREVEDPGFMSDKKRGRRKKKE